MKAKRLEEMESFILSGGSVTMEELRDHFGISMNTVRRDIAEIVKPGYIEKVYGGVRAMTRVPALVPYSVRSGAPDDAKRRICMAAGRMVSDGDIIFIDSGTTTVHVMDAIRDKAVTVITNNIEVMIQALEYDNIRIIVIPGEIHRKTHSITGEDSAAFLSHLNTDIAFMAATGASFSGVTNSSPLEYSIKRAAVAHTRKAVLLITGGKFGVTSLLTYASLSQFHTVITDGTVAPEYREKLRELNTNLVVVDD